MICSPIRILKLLLLTARMLSYGERETLMFFNKKIDLSRFAPVNCPYDRVFKGVSGAWPDNYRLTSGHRDKYTFDNMARRA